MDDDGLGSDGGLLRPGSVAPAFTLPSGPDSTLALRDMRGTPVVLLFHPAPWSPACGEQLADFNRSLAEFAIHEARLLGISADSAWCHAAFTRYRNIRFPLLSDSEPKGAVSRLYGAYREDDGTCERAIFLLDAAGVIRWNHLAPIATNPGTDGTLAALRALGRAASTPTPGAPRPGLRE